MPRKLPDLQVLLIIMLCITGCSFPSPPDSSALMTSSPHSTPVDPEEIPGTLPSTPELSETPGLDLSSIEGPVLLIQTDFDAYRYLEPESQTSIPFEPPISDSQFRLRVNLSPSGRQMFFPLDESSGIIVDLRTGETVHNYTFSGPELFTPELAAAEAEPLVTELALTEASLHDAVTEAHQHSRQLLRWYQSDRYHLSVLDTGETRTSLFLDDHLTGTRLQLEAQPGFVEDFRIGPDGNLILIKKGLVFWPGAHRDKSYYLLNVEDQSTQPVMLPDDTLNPSVTWFTQDTIGIVHQATTKGASGFSLININTLETSPIITGEFGELHQFGDYLLIIQRSTEPETTTLQLLTPEGERVSTQTVNRHCFYQYAASDRFIFQCELDSFLLDQDLNIEPFIESVLTLWPAPDGKAFVIINRSEQGFLLDADLNISSELPLEETPLEILWLPDSSSFLYRSHGKLFHFDLSNAMSHLLIESDLFSDYTNLNAVWINLE